MSENTEELFKKIYEQESDNIFRFCLVRVSDREQALDLVQETFMRLWNSLQEGTEILEKRAFLFTVARRLVIDWYRKKKSVSLDKIMEGEENNYDIPDENNLNNIELGTEAKLILEKINQLSETYRDPVYLRLVEDLTPKEIGEILGATANVISVRINRGLEELRKLTDPNIEE